MDKKRAREIAASPVMANVLLDNHTPVYIQHVDDKNETARVYPLDQPHNHQEVALNSLREQ
ncbi:H-type small acid-soluble spore protein [Bacillus taeanensis]|uniref:Small, acid-soluble spore protein H n=1 Tax=Bacillus taeanensis TaxID=273032 RepID=A0A366XS23_9BACI|nr:H-type small acid-soluble spore protein [Bacillus taeanensis]RBW68932.1 H-type small acid-soluble spore protein [Bacillus taeanensis]